MSFGLSQAQVADINTALAAFSSNGVPSPGLEGGTDQGLPRDAYIAIPNSMRRSAAAKLDQAARQLAGIADDNAKPQGATATTVAPFGDWVVIDRIRIIGSEMWAHTDDAKVGQDHWVSIEDTVVNPTTIQSMAEFIAANINTWNSARVHPRHRNDVIATRWWAVVCGLVVVDKNTEYNVVQTPDAQAIAAIADLGQIINHVIANQARSITWLAARGVNWRKMNHATGGTIATGFAQKALGDLWRSTNDRRADAVNNEEVTSMFYAATHAASVHGILAQMAPDCDDHWASLDPRYGFLSEWSVGDSVRVRLTPKDQVAGTALVTDSVTVLKMIVRESLSPLIANRAQIPALMAAAADVLNGGMRAAVYANWYFRGHPTNVAPVQFSQRGGAFQELASELGVIASKYYVANPISKSPALRNAANQSSDSNADTTWTQLYAARRGSTAAQALAAVAIIQGASAAEAVARVASNEEVQVFAGVAAFNSIIDDDVAALNSLPNAAAMTPRHVDAQAAARRAVATHGAAFVTDPSGTQII